MNSNLFDNIENVKSKIENASKRVGRVSNEVLLLAVTKTVDTDIINEAISMGIVAVGENKPQELTRKFDEIGPIVKWHQIGSLQTNKVKYIIDKVDLIHSLDRFALAEEIEKRASAIDREIECLVQVNISGEESKHGLPKEEVIDFIRSCSEKYHRIKIVGLMTMAPFDASETEIRDVFSELKKLSENISVLNFENVEMRELSMGMSNDFEIAIEEGATIVRVGSMIFGDRKY